MATKGSPGSYLCSDCSREECKCLQALGQLYRRVKERAAEAKQEVSARPKAMAAAGEGAFDQDLVPPAFLGSEDFWEEVVLAQVCIPSVQAPRMPLPQPNVAREPPGLERVGDRWTLPLSAKHGKVLLCCCMLRMLCACDSDNPI